MEPRTDLLDHHTPWPAQRHSSSVDSLQFARSKGQKSVLEDIDRKRDSGNLALPLSISSPSVERVR